MTETDIVSPTQLTQSKKSKRCGYTECKKKLSLTDSDCRCGIRFCMNHRHAETHNCTYDYRAAGRALLSSINVQCVASKLDKV